MDGSRDQFLAGPRLAGKQDRRVSQCNLFDRFQYSSQTCRFSDDVFEPWSLAKFGAQLDIFGFELLAQRPNLLIRKRVCDGYG